MKAIRTSLKLAVLAAAVAVFLPSAQAWTYQASGPWGQFNFADGYTVYENGWGSQNDNSQTLYANSASNWATYVNFTGGGVKNYPHTQKDVDLPLDGTRFCNASFNVSVPNNPWYNFMFDNWSANMQDELIVSEQWNGDAVWGDLLAQNVSIGGRQWNNIRKANNGANNVLVFTPSSKRTSGTEDCMALFIWAKNNGYLVNSSSFHQLSFGVEVTYTSGWQQFTVNSYSASFGQNSSGGGGGSGSGGSYKQLINHNTGLLIDGMGRSGNGSDCGQWSNSGSGNQKWDLSNNQIKNQSTGLMLDGMGRSGNGSVCGQWSNSGSNAQKWNQESYNGKTKFKNQQTGLYLDGNGYTGNGSTLNMWSGGSSWNQEWTVQ